MNELANLRTFEPAVEEDLIKAQEQLQARQYGVSKQWQNLLLFVCAVLAMVFVNPIVCLDEPLKASSIETDQEAGQAFIPTEPEDAFESGQPANANEGQTVYETVHNQGAGYDMMHYPLYIVSIADLFDELTGFSGMPDTFYIDQNKWNQGSMVIPNEEQSESEEQPVEENKPEEEELKEEEPKVVVPVVYPFPEGYQTIYSLTDNYALLTFDDGPSIYTKQIVDILNRYQVKATFFFIGVHTDGYHEEMKYVADHDFMIGNHSYSHREMSLKTIEEQKQEISRTGQIIENVTGQTPVYFRPPYGNLNDNLKNILHGLNMKTVLWNKDPADWDNKTAEEIIKYITDTQPYGGIYLLHETAETVAALPMIIEFLLAQNVEFVTLE